MRNPMVKDIVTHDFGLNSENSPVTPQPHWQFVSTMKKAYLILTDHGGVQEEALAFLDLFWCYELKPNDLKQQVAGALFVRTFARFTRSWRADRSVVLECWSLSRPGSRASLYP